MRYKGNYKLYNACEVADGSILIYDVVEHNRTKNHWSYDDCTVMKFGCFQDFSNWLKDFRNIEITAEEFEANDFECMFSASKL